MQTDVASLSLHNLPNCCSIMLDRLIWSDYSSEHRSHHSKTDKNNSLAFFYFHLISAICHIMHNEKVIIASGPAKVECAVLLALGSNAGIPWGRWTRKWSSFNTTQLSECLLSLKAPFFSLLPDEQRSNSTFRGADQTLLQPINHKCVLIFWCLQH